jgi:hypothetical protein
MFAEFSPKWRSRSSHLRGGSYNRTVVPKTLPDAARSSPDAAHLGQLGGEDLGREDLWWRVEESSSIDQQAREERVDLAEPDTVDGSGQIGTRMPVQQYEKLVQKHVTIATQNPQ